MENILGDFLRTKLCAGWSRLVAALMLVVFGLSSPLVRADEPVKLALVSTSTTSLVAITNAIKTTPKVEIPVITNAFSVSASRRADRAYLPARTLLSPSDDLQPSTPTVIVIKKNAAATGLFSDQGGNGSFGFANIQAGYGQAYDSDSIVLRGRNGTAWEETRYVFVKKVIKF